MILHYFNKKEIIEDKIAKNVYKNILKRSNVIINSNDLFENKDYNSSFEIVSILLIIYIKNNINFKYQNYKKINEALMSIFISDLDESLRQNGIGDMSIGKYVKKYVKKFYYRLKKFPKDISNCKKQSFVEYLLLFELIRKNEILRASEIIFFHYKEILNEYNKEI